MAEPTPQAPLTRSATPSLTRWQETVLLLLAYSLLTVALTWPLVTQFTTNIPDGNNSWRYLWNLWWAKSVVAGSAHQLLLHNLSLLPERHQPLRRYAHAVVRRYRYPSSAFGAESGNNLQFVASFELCFGGLRHLPARQASNRQQTSRVCQRDHLRILPLHFAHMLGHLNIASIQWIPFYVLALLKTLEPPQAPPSVAAWEELPTDILPT